MEIPVSSFKYYEVFPLKEELRLSTIPELTPTLYSAINHHPHKQMVLDLSMVTFMDSSAIRFLLNLKQRLETAHKRLYILKPSETVIKIISSVNLDRVLLIIDNCEKIEEEAISRRHEQYLRCSRKEGKMRRVACQCAVCGSDNTIAYLVDHSRYEWRWEDDDPFPTIVRQGTDTRFDLFAVLPAVCMDCYMCSIDLSHFHAIEDDTILVHATLDDSSKHILSKSIKKRKLLMEGDAVPKASAFLYPREPEACYFLYLLAEMCASGMAVTHVSVNNFWIGYLNYLAIQYADDQQKKKLIDNCRTWLTQVLNEKETFDTLELARAYFILMNAALNLEKRKEAAEAYQGFKQLVESMPKTISLSGPESPTFWFEQAQRIWHSEIKARSQEMQLRRKGG